MECPYCKDVTMKADGKLGKDWSRCPNCQATYCDDPKFQKRGGKRKPK